MKENDQHAKCLRVIITSIFADGTSIVTDIPEPTSLKTDIKVSEAEEITARWPTLIGSSWQTHAEFTLTARLDPSKRIQSVAIPVNRHPLCDEMPQEQWIESRFSGACYFYPARDCPGYSRGMRCGRMGTIIPLVDEELHGQKESRSRPQRVGGLAPETDTGTEDPDQKS